MRSLALHQRLQLSPDVRRHDVLEILERRTVEAVVAPQYAAEGSLDRLLRLRQRQQAKDVLDRPPLDGIDDPQPIQARRASGGSHATGVQNGATGESIAVDNVVKTTFDGEYDGEFLFRFVLQGQLELITADGFRSALGAGDAFVIPAGCTTIAGKART